MTKEQGILSKVIGKASRLSSKFKHGGLDAALTWTANRLATPARLPIPKELTFRPRGAKYPLVARSGESSDMNVLDHIFLCDDYAVVRDIAPMRTIIDLGANVGFSSAYFLTCFPSATLVAVEPDPSNADLCKRNLEKYGSRALVVEGAAWSVRSKLAISRGTYRDGREWTTQVAGPATESTGKELIVEGWDIPSLIQLTGSNEIDLLKIDIERSESEIFGPTAQAWLPSVKNICIELHDEECEAIFFSALANSDYDLSHSGELTICRNVKAKAKAAAATA